jgi:hypothetical protein
MQDFIIPEANKKDNKVDKILMIIGINKIYLNIKIKFKINY